MRAPAGAKTDGDFFDAVAGWARQGLPHTEIARRATMYGVPTDEGEVPRLLRETASKGRDTTVRTRVAVHQPAPSAPVEDEGGGPATLDDAAIEVACLLCQGLTRAEIRAALGLSDSLYLEAVDRAEALGLDVRHPIRRASEEERAWAAGANERAGFEASDEEPKDAHGRLDVVPIPHRKDTSKRHQKKIIPLLEEGWDLQGIADRVPANANAVRTSFTGLVRRGVVRPSAKWHPEMVRRYNESYARWNGRAPEPAAAPAAEEVTLPARLMRELEGLRVAVSLLREEGERLKSEVAQLREESAALRDTASELRWELERAEGWKAGALAVLNAGTGARP